MNEAAVYDVKKVTKKGGFGAWAAIFRPPFHTMSMFSFSLGAVLAWYSGNLFNWPVFLVGHLAVILIINTCFLVNEYYDLEADKINRLYNRFTGGTRVLPEERLSPDQLPKVGIALTVAALLLGIVLQFYFKTGPWTIPLGVLGYAAAVLYTAKPVRLAYRGLGEAAIIFAYGGVTLVSGYYLQVHHFSWLPLLVAVAWNPPNVSLLWMNEFPDYESDKLAGKRNLVVRLGLQKSAIVYIVLMILMWILTPIVLIVEKLPVAGYTFFLVPLVFSVLNVIGLIKGDWKDRKKLEGLCLRSIIIPLSQAAAFIGIFIWGGLVR